METLSWADPGRSAGRQSWERGVGNERWDVGDGQRVMLEANQLFPAPSVLTAGWSSYRQRWDQQGEGLMGGELTGMTFREEVCRMRAVRHREAVGVLEVLRTGLDGALGSLLCSIGAPEGAAVSSPPRSALTRGSSRAQSIPGPGIPWCRAQSSSWEFLRAALRGTARAWQGRGRTTNRAYVTPDKLLCLRRAKLSSYREVFQLSPQQSPTFGISHIICSASVFQIASGSCISSPSSWQCANAITPRLLTALTPAHSAELRAFSPTLTAGRERRRPFSLFAHSAALGRL